MPVSSVTLTVSHLPTSTSFYLSALQPLGYQYVGQWGNQIGMGADGEADFFLTQEVPGLSAGTTHVAFDAPSRAAVHSFFAAALAAGATPHGAPGARYGGDTCFNAAVIDVDGNSVEVIFHENLGASRRNSSGTSGGNKVKVLEWRDTISTVDEEVISEAASRRSTRSVRASVAKEVETHKAGEQVSAQDVLATLQQSLVSGASPGSLLSNTGNISISPKALAGTILGAAAGAAVAYAMCKSEEDSARAEEHAAVLEAASRRRSSAAEETKSSTGSKRGSVRKIEAAAPEMIAIGTQTFKAAPSAAPSRRETPMQFVPLAASNIPSRSPTVISARSVRQAALEKQETIPKQTSRAASVFEPPKPRTSPSSAAKSEAGVSRHSKKSSQSSSHRSKSKAPERRSSILPDIDEGEQLAATTASRHSRTSKKTSHSHRSSSRPSSNHTSRRQNEDTAPNSSAEFVGIRGSDDDRDTVVPSDSISCIGTSSAHHRTRKSKSSKHYSKQVDRHDDARSEPPIRKSRKSAETEGSGTTITPKTYKERSVMSLPLRDLPIY